MSMKEQFVEGYTNSQLRKLRGVYCFTFPNGKRYVGIVFGDSNFGHRFCCHLKDVRKGSQYAVHCAIRKYGWRNVKIEIVLKTDDMERSKSLEKQLIAFWKLNLKRFGEKSNGYNMTDGGDGHSGPSGVIPWNKGKKGKLIHTEETKRLISERSKEMWRDGTHTREKQAERNRITRLNNPNIHKKIVEYARKKYKKFNYEFYFEDGTIERPLYWREFLRETIGNEDLANNIRGMLRGERTRVRNIIRVIKYDLEGNLVLDSNIQREKYLKWRKEYLLKNKKLNKGCRYIVQEPSGEKVIVQHLTNYCKEKGITIFALMRKYKGRYPGVSGYKVIEKIGS